jgi:hypothetical protein
MYFMELVPDALRVSSFCALVIIIGTFEFKAPMMSATAPLLGSIFVL